MAVNKVNFGNNTLIDLTNDSVAPDLLMKGVTAHQKNGEVIVGTFTLEEEVATQDDLITQIQQTLQGKSTGIDTSDATATAEDIMLGKTAYAGGNKIEGKFTIDEELSAQGNVINQILSALEKIKQ